jgi:predicted TIM-barrel fold metal-dependent hydrolase
VNGTEHPGLAGAIDMHAHFLSPGYRSALATAGIDQLDGMPNGIPAWSIDSALELMDDVGVATSVLSVSSPGLLLAGDAEAVALARTVNDEAADLVRENPARFRFVASLPLPDVDASLRELDRSATELLAAGVLLLTNYRGIYLGDRAFEPLFQELDRRGSLVVIHPTAPCGPAESLLGYPPPLLEFIFDTTRAVVNLALSGMLGRYPNIRYVVPHGGAALPILVDRVGRVSGTLLRDRGEQPVDVTAVLRRLHYDLAGGTPDSLLPALLELTDTDHLVYGSDYPFTPASRVRELGSLFAATGRFTQPQRELVLRANAQRLLAAASPA